MKKVLIIGGTSQVAQELIKQLCQSDFEVMVASSQHSKLLPLQKDVELRYEKSMELIHFDAWLGISDITEKHLNDSDWLVCFSGYLGSQEKAENDIIERNKIVRINYLGLLDLLEDAARVFGERKYGLIAVVGSVAGDRGRATNYFYGSAKAALHTYLSGLRNRMFKSQVHVQTYNPGYMDTAMTSDMDLPGLLTTSPQAAAKFIFKNLSGKRNVIYVKPVWRWIMLIIKCIPERIFKKLNL